MTRMDTGADRITALCRDFALRSRRPGENDLDFALTVIEARREITNAAPSPVVLFDWGAA